MKNSLTADDGVVALLRCPETGEALHAEAGALVNSSKTHSYPLDPQGIPQFASSFLSDDARVQQEHYDKVADAYLENLGYPHTQEYMAFLDKVLLDQIDDSDLGRVAELCCGQGEAFKLIGDRVGQGVGVDVSLAMLRAATQVHASSKLTFLQADATRLPLADGMFDSVFMLGGIHHVNDRDALFREVARLLKPGGRFYFREPLSDFWLWRLLRSVIYRLSPALDHATERPLRHVETVPVLERAGLTCTYWKTHGFLGFCFLMNSDILVFNRLFRFIPGIRGITRLSTRFDELMTSLPGLRHAGLQVVGVAQKP